jgi:hypothetical protein
MVNNTLQPPLLPKKGFSVYYRREWAPKNYICDDKDKVAYNLASGEIPEIKIH